MRTVANQVKEEVNWGIYAIFFSLFSCEWRSERAGRNGGCQKERVYEEGTA